MRNTYTGMVRTYPLWAYAPLFHPISIERFLAPCWPIDYLPAGVPMSLSWTLRLITSLQATWLQDVTAKSSTSWWKHWRVCFPHFFLFRARLVPNALSFIFAYNTDLSDQRTTIYLSYELRSRKDIEFFELLKEDFKYVKVMWDTQDTMQLFVSSVVIFLFLQIPNSQLDPVWQSDDIGIFRITRKAWDNMMPSQLLRKNTQKRWGHALCRCLRAFIPTDPCIFLPANRLETGLPGVIAEFGSFLYLFPSHFHFHLSSSLSQGGAREIKGRNLPLWEVCV